MLPVRPVVTGQQIAIIYHSHSAADNKELGGALEFLLAVAVLRGGAGGRALDDGRSDGRRAGYVHSVGANASAVRLDGRTNRSAAQLIGSHLSRRARSGHNTAGRHNKQHGVRH
jgi:hypothetical protein